MKAIGAVLAALVVLLGPARSQTSVQKGVFCSTDSVSIHLSYMDSVYNTGDSLTLTRQISNLGATTAYAFAPPMNHILQLRNCETVVEWGGVGS
jgi:hypothetical protein